MGLWFQGLVAAWVIGGALSGCGSEAAPMPKAADTPPPPLAEASPAPAVSGEAPAPEPEAKPEKDPNAPREVKYVVTPEGLKIEVAGVRFLAAAAAKQVAQGWGVKVSVKAESLDAKEHVLLNPKNGPLAFAAAVFKSGATEAERIADAREGDGSLTLGPGSPSSFSRDFPSKGGRVLGNGDTLDLEVALWGLGDSADARRPVKQFFHVKMKVDKGKPKAIVEPPASVK